MRERYRSEDSKVVVGEITQVARIELHVAERLAKKFLNARQGSAERTSNRQNWNVIQIQFRVSPNSPALASSVIQRIVVNLYLNAT